MFYEGLYLYQKTGVNTARTLYVDFDPNREENSLGTVEAMIKNFHQSLSRPISIHTCQ
jgi:hypothetical protein